MAAIVLIRGGGDLASGVALRLHHAGLRVVMTELPQPLVVRRLAAFAEAVSQGWANVEGVIGRRAGSLDDAGLILAKGDIPVLVDPDAQVCLNLKPCVVVDGRMTKRPPDIGVNVAPLVIGLGPGFTAGENCHAVIETQRGHTMGRVFWQGSAQPDTGIPEILAGSLNSGQPDRILRAPTDGILQAFAEIGDHLEPGQLAAEVSGEPVYAPFRGVLRGLLRSGFVVWRGLKIGDVDSRDDPRYCTLASDKSLAVAGGVLEAILARPVIRRELWG
jgi:xanthine dehydrogenase accessory factor